MFKIDNSTTGTASAVATGPRFDIHAENGNARRFDLAWLMSSIWKNKLWIILLTLLGAVGAGLLSLTFTPRYQATAQMIIDPRELRVIQNEVTPGAVGSDSTTAYAESQARVIASDSVKMRLIEAERLDTDPEFGGRKPAGPLDGLMRDLGLGGAARSAGDPMLTALRALEKKILVRRGERTFIIDITATSEDPLKAARLANALANAYLDDQSAVRSDTAKRTTASLTGRLAELRQKLREAEEKAETFKAQKDIVGVAGKLVNDEQLSLLNAQLQQLRAKTVESRAKYEQVRSLRPASLEAAALPEAVISNTITALRSQLGAALNREADLLAAMGARHPSLVAARIQVQDARRQIADELGRIGQAAKIELDRTQAAEKALAARVDSLKRDQVGASRSFVDLRELEREVESSRTIYETFLRRARETAEQVGVDTTNARIISAAFPPETKSGASRKAIIMLGGLMGLGFGMVLALGRGMVAGGGNAGGNGPATAPAARTEPEAGAGQKTSAAADTASVAHPASKAGPGSFFRRFSRGADKAADAPVGPAPAAPLASAGVGQGDDSIPAGAPLLATLPKVGGLRWKRGRAELASVFQAKGFIVDSFEDTSSEFAQGIRQIRAGLMAATTGSTNRKILVTSLRPGAGSSTIALNLALATAIDGRTPLLVDAGRGDKSLTSQLAADATLGFADIISGGAGMVRAALQDEETGVFFLPRIGKEATGSTAVTSLDKALLTERFFPAARRFDSVIVDGSALGTDQMTQAFTDAVDDIVLVVRAGAAGRDDLARIESILGPNAAKIRGFVINRA
jgi:uncharacterized protein involved in exopolysaccharide biosynthesis/Mrp family chromosome partitioning ATPase